MVPIHVTVELNGLVAVHEAADVVATVVAQLVPEVDQVRMPAGKAVELADLVTVVFCKLVPEVDPVEVAVLLDDVFLVHDCGCDWPFRFRMM